MQEITQVHYPPELGKALASVSPWREAWRRFKRHRLAYWSLWLLSGNPELTGALKMKASRRIPISNGGIDCRWLHYEVR